MSLMLEAQKLEAKETKGKRQNMKKIKEPSKMRRPGRARGIIIKRERKETVMNTREKRSATATFILPTNRDIMTMQIFRPFGGNLVSFVEKTTVVAESLSFYQHE